MTAEFYALRGVFLAQLERHDEAHKAFSSGCQLHDILVKAWALWGDHLEHLFTREKLERYAIKSLTYKIKISFIFCHSFIR